MTRQRPVYESVRGFPCAKAKDVTKGKGAEKKIDNTRAKCNALWKTEKVTKYDGSSRAGDRNGTFPTSPVHKYSTVMLKGKK